MTHYGSEKQDAFYDPEEGMVFVCKGSSQNVWQSKRPQHISTYKKTSDREPIFFID
jgi:hypothetical protein